jgi:conjugative transfer signal peptidase TraF
MAGAILAMGALANALGLRINLTASMPVGLYHAQARTAGSLQRDTLVLICPPDTPAFQLALKRNYIGAGSCPNHSQPLLKPVAAVPGDTVTLSPQGVRVNRTWLPHSPILSKDSAGRPLSHWPFGQYAVRSGEVWLLSTHSRQSYDSRYFGPMDEAQITTTVTPLWTGG